MVTQATPKNSVAIGDLDRLLRADSGSAANRVFYGGEVCEPAELGIDVEQWLAAGLLRSAGEGQVASALRYQTYRGLTLASDRIETPFRRDHVLGLTGSAKLTAAAIPRHGAERALDLGTGCGLLALLAARHATEVVAVDINPRAIATTRFNCQLNGIENVRAEVRSAFDGFGDDRFDLVLANPPFAISPVEDLTYRDSGLPGDEASSRFVQAAARALAPGGVGVVMVNWIGTGFERPTEWISDTGCAAWIITIEETAADRYADMWASIGRGEEGQTERANSWRRWLELQGIGHISTGLVVLTPSARPTVGTTRLKLNTAADLGPQLRRGVMALAHLEANEPPRSVRLASDVKLRPDGTVESPVGRRAITPDEQQLLGRLSAGSAVTSAHQDSHGLLRGGILELW